MVVPYNKDLCVKYDAHINVECVAERSVVKYLYNYVHKGHDRATIILESGTMHDDSEQPRNGIQKNKFRNIWIAVVYLLLNHFGKFLSLTYNSNILLHKNFNTTYLEIS